jgi:hypothetical protein
MAFANRGEHHNCTMGLTWTDGKNDEEAKKWSQFFGKMFEEELLGSGGGKIGDGGKTTIYVNNIEREFHTSLLVFEVRR